MLPNSQVEGFNPMTIRRAVYPGTFDPVHNGHLDIVARAARVFDVVYMAVFDKPNKKLLFSVEERVSLLKNLIKDMPNVRVAQFSGLLVDYVRQVDAIAIVRGLRVFSDFELEFRMALANRRLAPEVEVVNLIADEKTLFLSSSTVREIASFGGDVSSMVPPEVATALAVKFNSHNRVETDYLISLQD
jgi:pantetheine-phosphate adenylyltransferase